MDTVFPQLESNWNHDAEERRYELVGGLTKREYFAAQIAAGMCAYHGTFGSNSGAGDVAERAAQVADALLTELAK